MSYVIGGTALFLLFLGFVIGYLLGWRSGHLTGIEYALGIWVYGVKPPASVEVAEYTRDIIAERAKSAAPKKTKTVKEETLAEIEELHKRGIK